MSDQAQAAAPGLVVEADRSTQLDDGLAFLDVGRDALDAAVRGDWMEASLNASLTGVDALGAVIDPFDVLFASGAAWVMEHLHPLPEMLSSVAGDPAAVLAMSATWVNIADRITETRDLYAHYVSADLADCSGDAVGAYCAYAEREIELLRGLDDMTRRAGEALSLAGAVVGTVRATVRDLVSEAAAHVMSLALQALATGGAAMPKVVVDIAVTVARYTAVVGDWLRRLVASVARLSDLLDTVRRSFDEVVVVLGNIRRWADVTDVAGSAIFDDGLADKPLISLKRADGGMRWSNVRSIDVLRVKDGAQWARHAGWTVLKNAGTSSEKLDEPPSDG